MRIVSSLIVLSAVAGACGGGSGVETTPPPLPATTQAIATTTTRATTSSTTAAPTTTTTVATTTTTTAPALAIPCPIESPSPEFDTTFYSKQCTVFGIPVLSSAAVADVAHDEAAKAIAGMLSNRRDLIEEMLGNGLRVGIIGRDEVTTDLPEHSELYAQFPGTDWNTRTRGLGGTLFIPLTSAGEENLLCLNSDVYLGESIFVHEFAHTVRTLGIAPSDRETDLRIEHAYDDAVAAGLWPDTYAITNSDEYWAEAVQSYFDTNASAAPPDGIHNDIDSHDELVAYDPGIYAIIDEVFASPTWRYRCP